MNYAEAAFIISVVTSTAWLLKALYNIHRDGKKDSRHEGNVQGVAFYNSQDYKRMVEALQEALRRLDERSIKDVQDLYEAMSKRNDLDNDRYHAFYKEFSDFRFQVARYMKNGGTH